MAEYAEYEKGAIYPRPFVNLVYSVAETVDELLDDIVGIRPVEHTLEVAENIAPANIIRRFTGIPKPSEVVEDVLDRIDEEEIGWRGPRFPSLPRFAGRPPAWGP